MKHTLLAFALTFGCSAAMMAESTVPEFAWANLFDGATTAGDQTQGISIAGDGSVYWHNIGGSTESAPDISYAGEVLFQGAPYNAGASNSGNLCIMKTDGDGNLLWNLHSTTSDFSSNTGGVAATSEDGVIFTAKVRHTDGRLDDDMILVDGKGETHTFDWKVDRRYYRLLVGCLDADGSLKWTRFIDLSTAPAPAATGNSADFTADAAEITNPVVDADGNIYIGGYFRADMTISGENGDVVLHPHNISTWTGDTQQNTGSLYVLKFNAEGEYVASLLDEGEADQSKILGLDIDGDKIYINGSLLNAAGEQKLGGVSYTGEGTFTPLIACIDTELTPVWVKTFKGEPIGGKYGYQNTSVTACNGDLWLVGMFNGTVSDPANPDNSFESTTGNIREGFILKLDAATGEWIKGVNSRESYPSITMITGYLKAVQSPWHPEKVYVFGYVMTGADAGVFMRTYDATTLTSDADSAWKLATGGGVPTAYDCSFNENGEHPLLYFTARGNKAFVLGDYTTPAPQAWGVLMACYELPAADFSTVVAELAEENDSEAEYYTLSGIRLNGAPTATGIYIRRSGTKSEKVFVK